MSNTVTIIPMSLSDLDEVIQIGTNTKQLQIDDSKNMFYDHKSLTRAINSPTELCLIAKDNNNTLAGFFLANINEVFKEVYICNLALKPEYRGQGIGQMFMTTARKILQPKKIDWSWALVQDDNINMHKFMEKQGYVKGKKFFFYYKPVGF